LNQIHQQINIELEDIAQHGSAQYPSQSAQLTKKRVHDLDFIGRERNIGDFERAAKHSSRVGWLKYILPAIGVIIIVLILAVLMLQPKLPLNITIGNSGIEEGKLLMNNPKLDGFDPKNRAYSVEAARAIQSIEDPTLVELEEIKAKLPLADNLWANITAGNGSFDVTEKKLELGGGVDIVTTDGMRLLLQDAYVDLKAGTMNTHRTINFTSSNASISAQSLEIFENGDRIVFDTNVLLTFQPPAEKLDEK
jgi:lipopolysaccharide export system protein LptC